MFFSIIVKKKRFSARWESNWIRNFFQLNQIDWKHLSFPALFFGFYSNAGNYADYWTELGTEATNDNTVRNRKWKCIIRKSHAELPAEKLYRIFLAKDEFLTFSKNATMCVDFFDGYYLVVLEERYKYRVYSGSVRF